jgi:hypothetical protein
LSPRAAGAHDVKNAVERDVSLTPFRERD